MDPRLAVSIADWNFDGYHNGILWYDIQIALSDATGTELATGVLREAGYIKGSFWMGACGHFEPEMPKVYPQIIGKTARENEITWAAL